MKSGPALVLIVAIGLLWATATGRLDGLIHALSQSQDTSGATGAGTPAAPTSAPGSGPASLPVLTFSGGSRAPILAPPTTRGAVDSVGPMYAGGGTVFV